MEVWMNVGTSITTVGTTVGMEVGMAVGMEVGMIKGMEVSVIIGMYVSPPSEVGSVSGLISRVNVVERF